VPLTAFDTSQLKPAKEIIGAREKYKVLKIEHEFTHRSDGTDSGCNLCGRLLG